MEADVRSIRRDTTLGIVLCTGLIMALGQLVIDRVLSERLLERFDASLEAKARALVTLTKFDGVAVELDFADEFMPEFESTIDPQYFELFLEDGRLMERSNSFAGHAPSRYTEPEQELLFEDLRLADGRRGRRVSIEFVPQIEDKTLRAKYPDWTRERAVLRVARERDSLDQSLHELHLLLAAIGVAVVLAAAASVVLVMRTGFRPLAAMTREVARIDARRIDSRLLAGTRTRELAPIAEQFNLMLERLEQALRRERQFSSDVAHELRTPVAELRNLAEVGLRWPEERSVRGFFVDVFDSARQLDTIVASLLHLSRGDNGRLEIVYGAHDLAAVVQTVWQRAARAVNGKQLVCGDSIRELPHVLTDIDYFELIVSNLLNNAVAYSPPDAEILCEARIDGGRSCVLSLSNPVTDLDARDLPHVFDRFWRKDPARTGDHHIGIGLAIVKSYAGCLGLEVAAQLAADGKFRIDLSGIRLAN